VRLEISLADVTPDTPAEASARAASIELDAARASLEHDATVQALRDRFGATLHADTVRINK
jgi:hypothetical protein